MRPIRGFLILYDNDENTEVSQHRDFDLLFSEWSEHSARQDKISGFVHVGHDRPHLSDVESLLKQHPGRVLLSEAARWALPPEFCNSTSFAGEINFANGLPKLAVHVANLGWGYEAEQTVVDSLPTNKLHKQIWGWVAELKEDEPEGLYEELLRLGVSDDDDYLLVRDKLPDKLRDRVDRVRFVYFRPNLDRTDPFSILSVSPYWLQQTRIQDIETTVRLANSLTINDIRTVGDLLNYDATELLRIPNLGRKSLRDLAASLWQAIEKGPQTESSRYEEATSLSLLENVEEAIGKIPDRPQQVLYGRLGREGEKLTLDSIGQLMKLTRERIRQIEKKYVSKIIDSYYWDDVIGFKIRELLRGREEPLYLDVLDIEDQWFRGFDDNPNYLKHVIECFTEEKYKTIRVNGRDIVCCISQDQWEELVRTSRAAIEDASSRDLLEEEVKILLRSVASTNDAVELAPLLEDSLSDFLHFAEENGSRKLVAFSKGLDGVLLSVLREAEGPLHYSEIYRRVRDRSNSDTSERYVHARLPEAGAKLFGRGIFGLGAHLKILDEDAHTIIEEVENIISNQNRQWHCSELLEILNDTIPDIILDLTNYDLTIILERSERLNYLGRFVWVDKNAHAKQPVGRIEISQTIISLLEAAGHPMHERELRQKLQEKRGTKQNLQIHRTERLIYLDRGHWGLIERDVYVSRDKIDNWLEFLHLHLTGIGKSVHLDELEEVLEQSEIPIPVNFSPGIIREFTYLDPRFKMFSGKYIGLHDWPEPRRVLPRDAVIQVVNSMQFEMPIETIRERVEDLMGLPCRESTLRRLLIECGASCDAATDAWNAPSDESDDIDDISSFDYPSGSISQQ